MDWNDETIARLRALWDEGHSTAEIGRRLGITKNAVVGKAHRLMLPARPSPIRREAVAGAEPRRAVPRPPVVETPPKSATAAQPAEVPARPAPAFRPVAAPRPGPRVSTCCWPIGDPGTPTFRFCDSEATVGKPYCAEHVSLAYVKIRDRREEAA